MEPSDHVYDSITSGALRMARRHWYVVAVGAVVGLLAGLVLSGSGAAWTANADVRILFGSVAPNPLEDPEGPLVDPNAVALRIEQSMDELDLADQAGVSVLGNSTAGLIQITATAPSEQEALEALEATTNYTTELVVGELGAATATRIVALEATSEAAGARLESADARLEALQAAGVQPGPSDPAVLERTAAADALSDVNAELQLARSTLETLSSTSVGTGAASTEETTSNQLMPVALAVLGAGAAFAVLLLLQAVDGRIRRRIHLEHSTPAAPVLGVLTRAPSTGELALLGRAAARFETDHDLERLLVVTLGGNVAEEAAETLREAVSCELDSPDLDQARSEMGVPMLGVIFMVCFGSVTEDTLRAVVSECRTAGTEAVGVVLSEVPRRDHAWAAASSV